MPTLDLQIATGSDDAQETATVMALSGNTNSNDLDAVDEWTGQRWDFTAQAVTDLAGATIDVSYMTVRIVGTGLDEPDVVIFGEDQDAPGTFTTGASNISGRTRTTASVAWASADLGAAAGQDFNTPSLNPILQELVNRVGFANTVIALLMQGSATSTRDLQYRFFEHGDGAAGAPRLHIEYTPAGGGGGILQQMMMLD